MKTTAAVQAKAAAFVRTWRAHSSTPKHTRTHTYEKNKLSARPQDLSSPVGPTKTTTTCTHLLRRCYDLPTTTAAVGVLTVYPAPPPPPRSPRPPPLPPPPPKLEPPREVRLLVHEGIEPLAFRLAGGFHAASPPETRDLPRPRPHRQPGQLPVHVLAAHPARLQADARLGEQVGELVAGAEARQLGFSGPT